MKTGLSVKQLDPLASRLTEAGHTGGAGKSLKTHVKADRKIIPGKLTPVSYTKPRWKKWKKTKSQQYKRKQAFKEKTSAALEAKHPGFKKTAAKNFPSFLKSAATKAKGGKV